MAAPPQPSPQQMQQMQAQFAAEAAKRGMTPQQFQQLQQQQITAEAAKRGMPVEQYVAELKANIMKQHQAQQQQQQAQAQESGHNHGNQPHVHGQGQSQPQQIAIKPGSPPAPEALAVAKFLRNQDLKPRTCIYNGDRKDMFKVKRALRALQSPAYTKAQQKANSNLPPVTDLESAQKTFTLLPISWLALQVSKSDPHEGHNHGPSKPQKHRTKGLWTVKVDQHMGTDPLAHYVWLYQGPQWKQKVYAAGALAIIMAIVMFPLWPITLRLGVWYLSMGLLGLLGLFFLMAIFRLILFCVTVFTVKPGLWLFPNLFEDVGVIDSFKPLWGWQPPPKQKKSKGEKKAIKASKSAEPTTTSTLASKTTEPAAPTPVKSASPASNGAATSTAVPKPTSAPTQRREYSATVEEADDE